MKFLLYGANGYTGQLIAENAAAHGLEPVLAGRSEAKIRPLAEQLNLAYKIFDLEQTDLLDAALREVPVVLHAAGPFRRTARPMIEACLRTQTHYLDITGEIPVFEMAASYDKKAKAAGILLMPGVGFDVVPTDCLALFLKKQLPDATHLRLAFTSGGGFSRGTAKTMAEGLGEGGAARVNGKIINVPLGHKTMWVPFTGEKKRFAMTIPWGDVATAYYTTGIKNIETYTAVKPATHRMLRWQKLYNWFLRLPFVKAYTKKQIDKRPPGPDDEQLRVGKSYIWGEVRNDKGETKSARLITPNGYQLTMLTALTSVKEILITDYQLVKTGFQTPAGMFSEEFIMQFESVERVLLKL